MPQGLNLRGLGPKRLAALAQEGITDLAGLLDRLPRSYLHAQQPQPIINLAAGEACVEGVLLNSPSVQYYGGRSIVRGRLADDSGLLPIFWFNQPWMAKQLSKGQRLLLVGLVQDRKQAGLSMVNPKVLKERGVIPQYKPLPGLPGKVFASLIDQALQMMTVEQAEVFPPEFLVQHKLCGKLEAWHYAHRPNSLQEIKMAQRRLGFENLLMYQLAVRLMGQTQEDGPPMGEQSFTAKEFWEHLPFAPTGAQQRTLQQILEDMALPQPMRRLVQGDVGSGKTAVAFGAAVYAIKHGCQCALMAPTELLARQHAVNARRMLSPFGIRCGLLIGGMKARERREALECIRTGEWQLVIGTHALISEGVEYNRLGLVITDEQHRFGVKQRQRLADKATGYVPHMLALSATPIPRSLALILYGDLQVSIMDELPPGRQAVKTRIVPPAKRDDLYAYIKDKARMGEQSYLVCPLVESDEDGDEEKQSAIALFNQLKTGILSDISMALTYGSQDPEEKQEALSRFYQNQAAVLVSTTVIEVGTDVPNATTMVIEDADMFGLAQLHQLRGRVGRGSQESWCFLLGEPNERLHTLTRTNDGFVIAEKDLELRGPGEFLGTRQHGRLLNVYGINDMRLVEETRRCLNLLQENPAQQPLYERLKKRAEYRYLEQLQEAGLH